MSDAAFKSAPFAAYTSAQLREAVERGENSADARAKMIMEIARRAQRDAGDVSVMTPGERLRHARKVA
jgi:hypothetical protein